MDDFESLLSESRNALERFIKFKVGNIFDADDIIQETCLSAYQNFYTLKSKQSFKAWLLCIARNKCNDYFRMQSKCRVSSFDKMSDISLTSEKYGMSQRTVVSDVIEMLSAKDKQILYLFFYKNLSQEEISRKLNIPIGTVKSRLFHAKKNFREHYPYPPKSKGDSTMKKLPSTLPLYTISPKTDSPFPIVFEELTNWFIIPKVGEKVTWGSYDMPGRNLTEEVYSEATGKIMLHGIEGVEICTTFKSTDNNIDDVLEHIYYAQLTNTHCRWLGENYTDKNGVKRILTFLDGDEFIKEWGFGEDNCGNEIHLTPKGDIKRNGRNIFTAHKQFLQDIVGRFSVEFPHKTYDTVCMMIIYDNGVATEQYIDQNGRTILWRRFNHNNWAYNHYKKSWTEILPSNEQISINGETYVHWYDCITDYII